VPKNKYTIHQQLTKTHQEAVKVYIRINIVTTPLILSISQLTHKMVVKARKNKCVAV